MNAWLYTLDAWGYDLMRYLLAVLWQSSLLFTAAVVLLLILRRKHAAVRHVVCLGALLLAPVVPLLSGWVGQAGAPQAPLVVIPIYAAPAALGAPPKVPNWPPTLDDRSDRTDPTDAALPGPVSRPDPLQYPWALSLLAYVVGLAVFLGLHLAGHLRIHAWLRESVPATCPRLQQAFAEACSTLGLAARVHVRHTAALRTPVSVGLCRRIVLFPALAAEQMNDEELRAVAIHEVAHLKRRDPLLFSLVALVRSFLFFHPLVWVASRQITALAEQAADDAVLNATGEPMAYAKLLTRLAEGLPRRTPSPEFAAGIVLSRNVFLLRVDAILSQRRDQLRRMTRWAFAGTVLMAVASLGVALAVPLKAGEFMEAENVAALAEPKLTDAAPVITGQVTDESGAPIAGALVEWGEFEAEAAERITTQTDSDGRYSIDAKRWGAGFRLGVSAEGYGPEWEDYYPPWGWHDVYRDPDALPPTERSFQLTKARRITGVVVDSTGLPVAGATVLARPNRTLKKVESWGEIPEWPTEFPGIASYRATTDKSGQFMIDALPAGNVVLDLEAAHRYAAPRSYPVDAPCRMVAEWSGKPGRAKMHVVDEATQQPVSSFIVARRHVAAQQHFQEDSGTAVWPEELTEDREYEFHVFAEGYAPWTGKVTATAATSGPAVDVALRPAHSLHGRLIDALSRQPVTNASLLYPREIDADYFAWNDWDALIDGLHGLKGVQRAVTDAEGRFWFAEEENQPGTLVVFTQGYARSIFAPEERPVLDAEGKLEVSVLPESTLSGTIPRPASGLAASVLQINLESSAQRSQDFEPVTTDAEGRFQFSGLQPGRYSISQRKPLNRHAYSSEKLIETDVARAEHKVVALAGSISAETEPANPATERPSSGEVHEVLLPADSSGPIYDIYREAFVNAEEARVGFGWARLAGEQNAATAGLEVHGLRCAIGPTKPYPDSTRRIQPDGTEAFASNTAGEGVPEQDVWSVSSADALPEIPTQGDTEALFAPLGAPALGSAEGSTPLLPYPLPRAYAFKTIDGDVGVFEIQRVVGRAVSLRYRWLELSEHQAEAPVPPTDPAPATPEDTSTPASQRAAADPALPTRGHVSGMVLDAATGAPVAGAFVAIDRSGDAGGANLKRFREEGIYVTAETDAEGRFVLEGVALQEEPHPFYATHENYLRFEQAVTVNAQHPEATVEAGLRPGASLDISLDNAPRGTRLRVYSLDGYRFIPQREDWPTLSYMETVLAKGSAHFGALPAGNYRLSAFLSEPGSLKQVTCVDRLAFSEAEHKNLIMLPTNADTEARIQIQAPPPEAGIIGTLVVFTDDVALAGLTNNEWWHVEDQRLGKLQSSSLCWLRDAELNQRGDFRIENFMSGEYTFIVGDVRPPAIRLRAVRIHLEAGKRVKAEMPWTEPSEPTAPKQAETPAASNDPSKPFSVSGTVVDADEKPVPNAEISVYAGVNTLRQVGTAATDETGRYSVSFGLGFHSLPGIMPQDAVIYVSKPGLTEQNLCRNGVFRIGPTASEKDKHSESSTKHLLPGAPQELNFILRPALKFCGMLIGGDGKPKPRFKFTISGAELPPASSMLCEVTTDAAGRFNCEAPQRPWWFEVGEDRSNTLWMKSGCVVMLQHGDRTANAPQHLMFDVDGDGEKEEVPLYAEAGLKAVILQAPAGLRGTLQESAEPHVKFDDVSSEVFGNEQGVIVVMDAKSRLLRGMTSRLQRGKDAGDAVPPGSLFKIVGGPGDGRH